MDTKDAQHLRKDLQDLVEVEDIITLKVGQAIARIGTDVVRITTRKPLDILENNCRDLIIDHSRRHYYRPIEEVRRSLRTRGESWTEPRPDRGYDPEEFAYDEV